MGKLKTAPAQKNQSFLGKMRVLSKENEFLYRVEVYLLNQEINRNGWKYLNLEEHKDLFVDTPLLVAYVGKRSVMATISRRSVAQMAGSMHPSQIPQVNESLAGSEARMIFGLKTLTVSTGLLQRQIFGRGTLRN